MNLGNATDRKKINPPMETDKELEPSFNGQFNCKNAINFKFFSAQN